MNTSTCRGCKRPISLIRLKGPFAPKEMVWWHDDPDYFPSHQARPSITMKGGKKK